MNTDEPVPAPARETWTTLEENQRFSHSILWKLQKAYYASRGPAAWTSGEVPHWATCNTYIAQCYADQVMAYLRDVAKAGKLDRREPLYIVELGAGLGAFASYFLHKFGELKAESSLRDLDVRYVMTDFTPTNLKVWNEHPHLRPFADAGVLTFGKFDMDTDDTIQLLHGGSIGPGTCKNPVVVLGNYVFDTFRQDIFRVDGGKLHEVQVTTRSPDGADFDLARLRTQYGNKPIDAATYYPDPIHNQLLAEYGAALVDTTFTLPIAGFGGLDRLFGLSGGRGMLITSDKGFTHLDELFQREQQSMQLHTGCFSMMVNYHAVGRYLTQKGGLFAATSRRQMNLKTVMAVVGPGGDDFTDTMSTFRRRMDDFGPGDFFDILQLERKADRSLDHILGFLKLSGYDPGLFYTHAATIREQCKGLPEWQVVELRLAIDRVWSLYYASPQNLPFELGRILLALGRPLEGARFNQISIDWFGEMPAAYLNMGICYYYAENPSQALRCLERSVELNPEFGLPREWIARIQAERARASRSSRAPAARPAPIAAPSPSTPAPAAPAPSTPAPPPPIAEAVTAPASEPAPGPT